MMTYIWLFLVILFMTPVHSSAPYLGLTISEYDVLGCHEHTNNPRCKKVIQIACKSICQGHQDDNTDFGRCCRENCTPHQPEKVPAES